jgi:UDP-N-acetylglucosamine--N-acetylmuramyl-(pentapeptide) pyrophosphoryl-undecaprenol N-acetylglucosamine transferase
MINKKIIIASSGTGGHVIPALNISELLLIKGYDVIWIGTKNGIENKLIKNKKIKLIHITSTGIRGKNFINKIKGLLNFMKSIFQSLKIIISNKPIFILGFGGYVSSSVSLAGFLYRLPVYAHESNSIAGSANKINNLITKRTFETFPNTFQKKSKVILSGNPLKKKFKNITGPDQKYKEKNQKINILIFGGSQGAKFFNENIPECFLHFSDSINIKHISGMNNKNKLEEQYKKYGVQVDVIEFSYEMEILYEWSDLIISRSGSMTLSEISSSGRASILIPYLYATDNHQLINARYLHENHAAVIIQEDNKFKENLNITIKHLLLNKNELYKMANNVKSLFPNDSSDIILQNIPELHEKLHNTAS